MLLSDRPRRRTLLAGISSLVFGFLTGKARAVTIAGALPWSPGAAAPPAQAHPGPWLFFTPEEASAIEVLVDRLIPPDEKTPGGKDAGCAVFIDRQLAGPYGQAHGLYMQGPFGHGTPEQGDQSPFTPAIRYRRALAALDRLTRAKFAGRPFAEIPQPSTTRCSPALRAARSRSTISTANHSSRFCWRTPRRGSSRIPCTAAIAIWRAGR